MPNSDVPTGRAIAIVGLAILATFVLLRLWIWSAEYPWSSDAWVLAIPLAIIVAGVLAFVALALMRWMRNR
jgi:hypothetical protein